MCVCVTDERQASLEDFRRATSSACVQSQCPNHFGERCEGCHSENKERGEMKEKASGIWTAVPPNRGCGHREAGHIGMGESESSSHLAH